MRKFFVLLKKELKEIITLQVIIPLIIASLALMLIGNVVGKEAEKASQSGGQMAVLDLDQSVFSQDMLANLRHLGYSVEEYKDLSLAEAKDRLKKSEISSLLVFPPDFGYNLSLGQQQTVDIYNVMRSISMMDVGTGVAASAMRIINEEISNFLLAQGYPDINPQAIKNPVLRENYVLVSDKEARAHPDDIKGFLTTQTMVLPIVLFMVIMIGIQMIVTSVASEKENKTLETLLSTPIKRTSLVTAKMVAAGIMGLLTSLFYLVGFSQYMGGFMGGVLEGDAVAQVGNTLAELGLILTTQSYILLGLSIFFGLLCALAIALILGVFADSVKSAQTLITPLMFFLMIPYLLSMFLDLNTVSPVLRYAINAIPFAHPFMAMPNLFLHNYTPVINGVIYQAIFFVITVLIAGRIYSTDRVMTMKLGRKKK